LLLVCLIQGARRARVRAAELDPGRLSGPALRFVWALLLFFGGAASIIGLWWPWDPIDGVLIKRVGLLAAAGGTLAYGLALAFLGPLGFIAAAYNIGFAVVCLIRAWQVSVALAIYSAHMQALGAARRAASDEGEPVP
jgi:hypothetical protein